MATMMTRKSVTMNMDNDNDDLTPTDVTAQLDPLQPDVESGDEDQAVDEYPSDQQSELLDDDSVDRTANLCRPREKLLSWPTYLVMGGPALPTQAALPAQPRSTGRPRPRNYGYWTRRASTYDSEPSSDTPSTSLHWAYVGAALHGHFSDDRRGTAVDQFFYAARENISRPRKTCPMRSFSACYEACRRLGSIQDARARVLGYGRQPIKIIKDRTVALGRSWPGRRA